MPTACDPTNLPKNCWIEADGTPVPVDRYQHAKVAGDLAPDVDPNQRFAYLFNLGYVRVQWENPTRTNIAFRRPGQQARQVVLTLVDFLLASGVSVLIVAPGDTLFLDESSRYWKGNLRRIMKGGESDVPADWEKGYGHPHA
jgi:hypothetical protein